MDLTRDATINGFVTLHLPCRYSYLRMIRQAILDMSRRMGFTDAKAAQLEMAVDEACTNVIEHSYGGEAGAAEPADHPGLRVNLMEGGDRIVVEIFDRGQGFDLARKPVIDPKDYLENRRERGLGLYIIQKFVDEVSYERATSAGNCLRLTKRR